VPHYLGSKLAWLALLMLAIKDLCDVKPSYLGFRGALCEKNQRALGLDATKVRSIKKMLH
jgi:4-HFC-P synthase